MAKLRDSDEKRLEDGLFIEMLEIVINAILYLRGVYPKAIFRKQKMYETAVCKSIFKPLNDYISSVLETARNLKAAGELKSVEVELYEEMDPLLDPSTQNVLEKFVFDLKPARNSHGKITENDNLEKFQQQLRHALKQFSEMAKNLNKPDECRFRIQLETTEGAFKKIVEEENSKAEPFDWVSASQNAGQKARQVCRIVPVGETDYFSMIIQRMVSK